MLLLEQQIKNQKLFNNSLTDYAIFNLLKNKNGYFKIYQTFTT